MPENLVKWFSAFLPFMATYPVWVKLLFAIFVLSGAGWLIGLVVAHRPASTSEQQAQDTTAWLIIKGVTGFGDIEGQGIRVTAKVNGTEYVYPTREGVDWLEIGPSMAEQSFPLPKSESYIVKFRAELRDPLGQLTSVEEQHIDGTTAGVRTYGLHNVDQGMRAAAVKAEIKYVISRDGP